MIIGKEICGHISYTVLYAYMCIKCAFIKKIPTHDIAYSIQICSSV